MSNLCQPHMAAWCKAESVKTQYMTSGRFSLRPNSFHRVPGQTILPFDASLGDTFDNHHHWENMNGGVAGAWCSTVIGLGSVGGHTPSSSITTYPVIKAILTNGSWPSTVPATNELIGGDKKCDGANSIKLINGFPQCDVPVEDFLSECHNSAPISKIPGGIPPACEYDDCGRKVPCNPCEGGPEAFGGPSEMMPSTYWSINFEYFLKDFMGVNQPDEKTHGCARTIIGKSSYGMETRTATLESPDKDGMDCTGDYCSDRNLDSPSAGSYDRPASTSEAWRDLGSHGSNRGVSWNFTSCEMRYTNIEDPGDPEYNNTPNPDCSSNSTGLWNELIWFQDGLGKTFPECPSTEGISEKCMEKKGLYDKDNKPIPNVTRDTPVCHYDPCWIGWTGGGKLPEEPECENNALKNLRWVRYYDRDLENEDCPPKSGKRYESKKYDCSFDQPYDGDIVPVPGWVEPKNRVYDYWCLIADHTNCLNVNLLLDKAEQSPFSQKTIFFHDPAFMSSRVLNSRKGLTGWRIPPCAENETNYISYPTIPSKNYCYLPVKKE